MRRDWKEILGEGLIAGLLGYAIVAVTISLADLVQGRSPFHTAAMLGSTVFFGLRDPAELVVWPGPVFAYNGLHLAVFLLLGAFMAWLASLAEGGPHNDSGYATAIAPGNRQLHGFVGRNASAKLP